MMLPSSSRALIITTFLCWLVIAAIGDISLLSTLLTFPHALGWIGPFIFWISIHVLWALTAYMLASLIVRSTRPHPVESPLVETGQHDKSVAIMLCVRDDWMEPTALSCLKAMRPTDHLYICDDSQSPHHRSIIDAFEKCHLKQCTIVRRKDLRGWKAGNVNHCLRSLPEQFDYFLLLDHDSYIPDNVIQLSLHRLAANPKLAFVQFRCAEDGKTTSSFAADLSTSVSTAWWLLSLRREYGFCFCVGHAVMFRRAMVEAIGGFPENTLAEDIAISMRLMNHGYGGAYDLSTTVLESVPESYSMFRARYCRWCIGTLQSWMCANIALSPLKTPLHVMLDALLITVLLLFPFPIVAMMFGLFLSSPDATSSIAEAGWGFKFIVVCSLLIPNVPLAVQSRNAVDAIRSIAINTAVYLSLIIPTVLSVTSAIIFRNAIFLNTGNRYVIQRGSWMGRSKRFLGPNDLGTFLTEVLFCIVCFGNLKYVGILGLPLLAGASCGILFSLVSWSSPYVSIAKYVPAGALLTGLVWLLVV